MTLKMAQTHIIKPAVIYTPLGVLSKLPRELRDEIYEYAYLFNNTGRHYNQKASIASYMYYPRPPKNEPGLATTSKTIRQEMLDRSIWKDTVHLTLLVDKDPEDALNAIVETAALCGKQWRSLNIDLEFVRDHIYMGFGSPAPHYQLSGFGKRINSVIEQFPTSEEIKIRLSVAEQGDEINQKDCDSFAHWLRFREGGSTQIIRSANCPAWSMRLAKRIAGDRRVREAGRVVWVEVATFSKTKRAENEQIRNCKRIAAEQGGRVEGSKRR